MFTYCFGKRRWPRPVRAESTPVCKQKNSLSGDKDIQSLKTLDACPKNITSSACICLSRSKGRPYGIETHEQRALTRQLRLYLLTSNLVIADANAFLLINLTAKTF